VTAFVVVDVLAEHDDPMFHTHAQLAR